jgi:hypothetical protein
MRRVTNAGIPRRSQSRLRKQAGMNNHSSANQGSQRCNVEGLVTGTSRCAAVNAPKSHLGGPAADASGSATPSSFSMSRSQGNGAVIAQPCGAQKAGDKDEDALQRNEVSSGDQAAIEEESPTGVATAPEAEGGAKPSRRWFVFGKRKDSSGGIEEKLETTGTGKEAGKEAKSLSDREQEGLAPCVEAIGESIGGAGKAEAIVPPGVTLVDVQRDVKVSIPKCTARHYRCTMVYPPCVQLAVEELV